MTDEDIALVGDKQTVYNWVHISPSMVIYPTGVQNIIQMSNVGMEEVKWEISSRYSIGDVNKYE